MFYLFWILTLCSTLIVREISAEETYDVIIVGGGVSGTYCAWRLSEKISPVSSICLLESSNRIGGRLFSMALPQSPNNQSWIIIPRIRHPIPDVNLYICGEAYSSNQGWIEGAVNTAEKLLQDHFNLPRASWIKPTYDLGP